MHVLLCDTLYCSLQDLGNNINMVLNREKASKAMRRYMFYCTYLTLDSEACDSVLSAVVFLCFTTSALWDEIHCDRQTESEMLHQQADQLIIS